MSMLPARLKKNTVVGVYSQIAPLYDPWGGLAESKARKKALALADIRSGESILEVAVGTGLLFQELLRANPDGSNVGIDLTPAMLAKARTKAERLGAKNYQLAVGDAYDLQFPDHAFDLLVNSYMFDLLPEQDFPRVLAEFKRVLKPNGRLVLINMTKADYWYQKLWESIYRVNPRWMGGCRGVLLAPALQQAGFMDLHRETMSQLGFPSEILTART
jgi:ubiquinone/menaquinone biosynthesis C-methylase UbiE